MTHGKDAKEPAKATAYTVDIPLLGAVDGRTKEARAYRRAVAELVTELGGEDAVSRAQMELVRRAAGLSVMAQLAEARLLAGERIEQEALVTPVNSMHRLLATLGLPVRGLPVSGGAGDPGMPYRVIQREVVERREDGTLWRQPISRHVLGGQRELIDGPWVCIQEGSQADLEQPLEQHGPGYSETEERSEKHDQAEGRAVEQAPPNPREPRNAEAPDTQHTGPSDEIPDSEFEWIGDLVEDDAEPTERDKELFS